ncbi:MAG: helix-turn-helix transcriptional regulator [Candidatus Wallbacteria bacterium]|nr:helix-turn-helix transcriptional regulator [Candidatus Wallbacteria bacterium]
MTRHRWNDVARTKLSAEQVEANERWAKAEVLELSLKAVRQLVGKTQVAAAKAAGMTQSELSKAERREDRLLSTLRRYIEALGGELEVIAKFGDRTVKLRGL